MDLDAFSLAKSWWDPAVKCHYKMLTKTGKMSIFSKISEYRADGNYEGRVYVLCCNFFVLKDTELCFAEHVGDTLYFKTLCHTRSISASSSRHDSKSRAFLHSNPKNSPKTSSYYVGREITTLTIHTKVVSANARCYIHFCRMLSKNKISHII